MRLWHLKIGWISNEHYLIRISVFVKGELISLIRLRQTLSKSVLMFHQTFWRLWIRFIAMKFSSCLKSDGLTFLNVLKGNIYIYCFVFWLILTYKRYLFIWLCVSNPFLFGIRINMSMYVCIYIHTDRHTCNAQEFFICQFLKCIFFNNLLNCCQCLRK